LPQAAAELEVKEFEGPLTTDQKSGLFAQTPFSFVRPQVEPDLTVVTRDGRKLKARLIGLDAETGLSVMQVIGILTQLPPQASTLAPTAEGQLVRIFAPEPIKTEGEGPTFNTFVRMGKIDATVARIKQGPLTTSGPGPAVITDALAALPAIRRETLWAGINCRRRRQHCVATIRAATRRVLERKASVPPGSECAESWQAAHAQNFWHGGATSIGRFD
jgi:hypothetical protein